MKASAWQKAVNEDTDNDMLHAVDSAKRRIAEPVIQKTSKQQRLQRQQKKCDKIYEKEKSNNKRLNKEENRLKDKEKHITKKKKKPKPKRSFSDKLKDFGSGIFKFIKNVYENEVKKFFGAIAVIVIILLLVFAFIIMIFSSISGGGGFTLGTYAAQDYDLSEAEKYYTKLAWDLNENVVKVCTDDWKKALKNLGVDTFAYNENPNEFIWGRSSYFNYDAVYDFDVYKLWAFLCAYYYDFDADNGDIKYWKFKESTKDLLDEIFNEEYEFVHFYDNTSHWEYRYNFEFCGYYSVDGSGVSGEYGYINISYPDALPFDNYTDGNTLYYDLNNGEVLDYSNNCTATGWYLKNQYIDDYDESGTKFGKWYINGEDCNYGIWENDVLVIPNPYVIIEMNWCSFLKKYDWTTDCRLYYNIKQKKTFNDVITEKLSSMSHSEERLQYYNLLIGADSTSLYGNHQTLRSLTGTGIHESTILNGYGYDMQGWNYRHIIGVIERVFQFGNVNDANISRCINNSKVTGHHAIIPTVNIGTIDINKLPDAERNILKLIVIRLISASAPVHKYEAVKVTVICNNAEFTANGKTVTQIGWKKYGVKSSDDKDGTKSLPVISEGQQFTITASKGEHFTSPPKPYTEDTLLSAMEHAGQADYDENSEKKGLGTPATRASIIEGLVAKGYADRKGKQIIATDSQY